MNREDNRIYYLVYFIALILLIVVIAIFIFFIFRKDDTKESNITPSSVPTPTKVQVPNSKKSGVSTVSVEPKEDIINESVTNPSQIIRFKLSAPIQANNLTATSNPSLPLIVKNDSSNVITVAPDPPEYWRPETLYVITILDEDGKVIDTYRLKIPLILPEEVLD